MLSATAPYPSLPSHPVTVGETNAAQQDWTDRHRQADQPALADRSELADQSELVGAGDPVGVGDDPVGVAVAGRGWRQALWPWARLVGGAAILGVVLWRVGSGPFLDGLRVLDGAALAAALGIGLVTTVCCAWRWCLVARGLGIRLRLASAVADYYRALFLNAALPGGILGDVHRAVRHGRDVGDLGRGVRAVVLERTAGQVVLVIVSVVVLLAHPVTLRAGVEVVAAAPFGARLAATLAAAVLVAVGVAVWSARRRRGGQGSRLARAARATISELRHGLFANSNWVWIAVSSALALAGYLATFIVAARTAGASASLDLLVPLMLLALLAMALPLNVGGWGPREGVCAWAFGAAGLSASQGLTVAVVYGLFTFVASLPGAGVLLARWLIGRRRQPGQAIGGLAYCVPNRSDSA